MATTQKTSLRSNATTVIVRSIDLGKAEWTEEFGNFRAARRWAKKHMFEDFSEANVRNIPGSTTWYVDFV